MKHLLILMACLSHGLALECFAQDSIDKFAGVCFSSIRDNESPARQITALPSAVEEDVVTASKLANALRTYTVSGSSYLIPEFCQKHQVDCLVGAWIGPLAWQNDAQLELLANLLERDLDRIKAVIVGNEVLHRNDCTEEQLIRYIQQIKKLTSVPVATADTWRAWVEHPKVAEEVDICGVQIYPYWEGHSIEGAAAYTVQRLLDVQNLYPNKRVVLTEFGWPTQGETLGLAQATPENAARYLREILPLLKEKKIEYYYFAVWDEKWKVGPEGNVGAHWGLFESNGVVKPEFAKLLPTGADVGSARPPRLMTFQLESDRDRNLALAQAIPEVLGNSPEQVVVPPGIGLDAPAAPVQRNSYAGLRPIRPIETTGGETKPPIVPPSRPDQSHPDQSHPDQPRSESLPNEQAIKPTATDKETSPALNANKERRQSTETDATETQSTETPATETPANKPPLGPNELHGVCLGVFRDQETPHFGITPLISELTADVSYASGLARVVRTYSVTDSLAFVPEICDQVGVECFPGASLGKYPWINDLELEMLIRVGQQEHPSVQALIVGNEVLHRGDFSVQQYIDYIRRVKQKVRVPIATAELLHSWLEHPELADEVDIVGVQIYPFWGGLTIDKAARNTLESVQQLQARFPGKRVVLTEFGWPTDGGTIGDAAATPENAARYLREVIPLLNEHHIEYMYFSLTDEKWKQGDEGGPGPHWGLLQSNGQVKPIFQALLPAAAAEGFPRPPRKLGFE